MSDVEPGGSNGPIRLREGDVVELRAGAPVPAQRRLQTGVQGRVVIADAPTSQAEVSVVFGQGGRPIRLHQRWLRLVKRPKGRGRPWQPLPKE